MKKNKVMENIDIIEDMLNCASLLDVVRKEANELIKNNKFVIVGGKFCGKPNYDVVLSHDCGKEINLKLARRLKNKCNKLDIKEFDDIVDNVMGIRFTRRGRL